jgi:hypothetical protein
MKLHPLFFVLLFSPALMFAQVDRKGIYGNVGIGYGTYTLDLYDYAGGNDFYRDQTFSGVLLSLGVEKKSAWQKNKLVFDAGGEFTGGFGIKTSSKASGARNSETKGGHSLGLKALFKAGYTLGSNNGSIIPLIGLGPYFNYLSSGGDADGNYIYGLQASLGADFNVRKRIVLTPEIHFGLASWGASDEMDQNGQPAMFEVKLKIARQF